MCLSQRVNKLLLERGRRRCGQLAGESATQVRGGIPLALGSIQHERGPSLHRLTTGEDQVGEEPMGDDFQQSLEVSFLGRATYGELQLWSHREVHCA